MASLTYPGVYVEEFQPAPPIQGVGTSTAAFLGPAVAGPLNEPTKVTSWDGFVKAFCDRGKLPLPGAYYLYYAVRGFFANGGRVCYVLRVSNGVHASADLNDGSAGAGRPALSVTSRAIGAPSPQIRVTVSHVTALTGAALFVAQPATIQQADGKEITVVTAHEARAAQFRPGDLLTWNGISEAAPPVVGRVDGRVIRLADDLTGGPYTTGDVTLANMRAGTTTTLRLQNGASLAAGSVIEIDEPAGTSDRRVVRRIDVERISPTLTTYRVDLTQPVSRAFTIAGATVDSLDFTLTVRQGSGAGAYSRDYANLSLAPGHPRFVADVVAADAARIVDVTLAEPPSVASPPDDRPRAFSTDRSLTGGQADDPSTLSAGDYRSALGLLAAVDDVNLVSVPDSTDPAVQQAVIEHCELLMDRFGLLDSRRGAPLSGAGSVVAQRNSVESPRGYVGLYYPWLRVTDATGKAQLLVPPSGHVAGVCARIDDRRGVHKSAAGREATVNDALAVETAMSDIDQGELNLAGVNVVRVFRPGGRPVVWGARTTASDTSWQYSAVRRLFLWMEESIMENLAASVFEPHTPELWKRLGRTIGAFLTKAWRDGALFGASAKDAFYVRIDEDLNPPDQRALGRLQIEIGAQPAYPAEFIVVRIGIWDGGGEINE